MDARSTPGRILGHHAEDQILQFLLIRFLPTMSRCGKANSSKAGSRRDANEQQFPALRLPRLVSISATAIGRQPKTADQCEQVWVLASGAAKSRAVDEGPDFPAGGHIENRGSVETDPTEAKA